MLRPGSAFFSTSSSSILRVSTSRISLRKSPSNSTSSLFTPIPSPLSSSVFIGGRNAFSSTTGKESVEDGEEDEAAGTMYEFERPSKRHSDMMLSHIRTGNIIAAEKVLKEMYEQEMYPAPEVYQQLLKIYISKKNSVKVVKTFNELNRFYSANLATVNSMASFYIDIGSMNLAKEMLDKGLMIIDEKATKNRPSVTGFRNVQVKFMLHSEYSVEEILEFVAYMSNGPTKPDERTFNTIIQYLSQRNRPEEAEKVIPFMKKMGLAPDEYTFNPLLLSYSRAGKPRDVLRIWNSFPDEQVLPSIASYNIMMQFHISQGQPQDVENLLNELQSCGQQPSPRTLQIVLEMYLSSNDMRSASEILALADSLGMDTMKGDGQQLVLTVMHHCAEAGNTETIRAMTDQIIEAGGELSADMYNYLIQSYVVKEDQDGVMRVWREMQPSPGSPGIKPNRRSYHVLMDYFARIGEPEMIRKLMKDMKITVKNNPTTMTYNLLLKANVVQKNEQGMLSAFEELVSLKLKPISSTFNIVISYYKSKGSFSEAQVWIEKMDQFKVKPCKRTHALMKDVRNRNRGRRKNYYQERQKRDKESLGF